MLHLVLILWFPILPGIQASPIEQGSSASDGTHIFCQRNRDNKSNSGYHELIRSIADCSSNSWRYLCLVSSFLMRFLPSSDIPDPWFLEVLVELWNMGITSHCKLVIGYTEPVHMFARFSISLGLLDAIFGWVIGEKLTLESNKQQIKGLRHRCFRAALVDQILSLQVDQFCKKVREI